MVETAPTPASIAREAKALTQSLKDLLKKHEPWEREIEFQRASLRRQFLQLLFVHPYAKESKDADHTLWLTTSYFIISAYKQRIAAADAIIYQTANEFHGHRGQDRHHGKPTGVVEHRKLVHRFRQFLAEEEKFWTSLVVRAVRVFNLNEARPALTALSIPLGDENENGGQDTSPTRPDRRNMFPNEDATPPPVQSQKEQKLIMLSKALVCLGDIARYREHYNEGGGRPRAGKDFHEDARPVARGRGGRRAVEQPPRPRNYSKAQECYERARLLVPDVGNACHQLAILASYQLDPFAGVLQYYRAMCVKQPYETAASNLDSTLARNLESYKKLSKTDPQPGEPPKSRVERFKKALITLHGLWKLSSSEAERQLPGHVDFVIAAFSDLVSERVLPTDIIWKTLIIAFGALWRFRVLRDPSTKRDQKRAISTEARIFSHILSVVQALFRIGCEQITEASNSPDPSVNGTPLIAGEVPLDLAQNITAVFRRTLPALRIGSKWLSAHYDYVSEAPSRLATDPDVDIPAIVKSFWETYDTFGTQLRKVFPMEKLPKLTAPLEEDVEVSGFAPLKKATPARSVSTPTGLEPGQSQVHPNEEQLMRIADLLADRQKVADLRCQAKPEGHNAPLPMNGSPKVTANGSTPSTLRDAFPPPEVLPLDTVEQPEEVQSEAEDDAATVSTKTEDDPVNLVNRAIRAVQDGEDDNDDDEQILLTREIMQGPVSRPQDPISPPNGMVSTPTAFRNPVISPPQPISPLTSKPLTAEDLVDRMFTRPAGSMPKLSSSTGSLTSKSTPLLFHSTSLGAPTSIWSRTTQDSLFPTGNRWDYSGVQTRVSPPAPIQPPYSPMGLSGAGNAPIGPVSGGGTPGRPIGYGHQRHVSQPPAFPPHPVDIWGSQSSRFSLSSSRNTLLSLNSLSQSGLQQPTMGAGSGSLSSFSQPQPHAQQQYQYQQQDTMIPGLSPSHNQLPSNFGATGLNPQSGGIQNQSTWSFSGFDTSDGMNMALDPYSNQLPRMHQQAPIQRSGSWAPT